MATILAQKSGAADNVIAKSDDHYDTMANDPAITAIPQGSTFGSVAAVPVTSPAPSGFGPTFSAPAAGFGSTGGSSSTGFGSSASFGGPTNNMGSVVSSSMGTQPVLTAAGSNAAQGADVLVANNNTDWINNKWRPVMGWMYMVVCICDFTLFPVLWSVLQALSHGQVTSQWQPLTLQGAGLFHVAMGAVLGIAAYGRTKEKVAGAA